MVSPTPIPGFSREFLTVLLFITYNYLPIHLLIYCIIHSFIQKCFMSPCEFRNNARCYVSEQNGTSPCLLTKMPCLTKTTVDLIRICKLRIQSFTSFYLPNCHHLSLYFTLVGMTLILPLKSLIWPKWHSFFLKANSDICIRCFCVLILFVVYFRPLCQRI